MRMDTSLPVKISSYLGRGNIIVPKLLSTGLCGKSEAECMILQKPL